MTQVLPPSESPLRRSQTGSRSLLSRRFVATGIAAVLTLGSITALQPATAAPKQPPTVRAAAVGPDCPAPMALADVTAGMTGEGLTVTTGTTPQAFDVEVLGVVKGGLAPGKDVIMVKASDRPGQTVIGAGGGIWAGMSGSPIYVDGKLLGAASYGFTLAPSVIFGVTPAEEMVATLSPSTRPAAQARSTAAMTKSARTVIAAAGESVPRGSLRQLPVPLSVSGVSPRSIPQVQKVFDHRGANVHAVAAGSASRTVRAAAATRPVAGGNFAAVVSYGDVSLTGVGTTTMVCGNQVLAFGHPFFQSGKTSLGAADADSVAILDDPAAGSFKLANPTTSFGVVDQDRFAAIRADLGKTLPRGTTVRTRVSTLSGVTGSSASESVDSAYTDLVAFYSAYYGLSNTADRVGPGQTVASYTIRGTRANGRPLVVKRSNRFADTSDPNYSAADDLAYLVATLTSNEYEPVTLDSIDLTATASPNFKQLRITDVAVSVNGGRYRSGKTVDVKPGDKLTVKTTMLPYRSLKATTSISTVVVPASAKKSSGAVYSTGGQSLAESGGDYFECEFDPTACAGEADNLTKTVRAIAKAPRNDVIETVLELEGRTGRTSKQTGYAQRLATVVGFDGVSIRVR